jgi:predicted hydrocarbon binding protein
MKFEFNSENGIIKDKVTGERCAIITQTRMQEILLRLSEIFQSGAKVIIFEATKAAGERFAKEVAERVNFERARMYKQFLSKTPNIQKTKCIAKGDAYCEWHVAPK